MREPERRRRWRHHVAVLATSTLVLSLAATASTTSPAGAAVPTCVPGAPAVVGSAHDRLVVTVPQCASSGGLTAYRVSATPVGGSATTVDVPVAIVQAEVA